MLLEDFVGQIPGFEQLPTRETCQLLAWHLHTHKNLEYFQPKEIGDCYRTLNLGVPQNLAQALLRMASVRKPPDLIKQRAGYKLVRALRLQFDKQYGSRQSSVILDKLLADLPERIPDVAEKAFFTEALSCYRLGAFRACIVMVWNLAYSHLLDWLLKDPARMAAFNSTIGKRFPKRAGTVIDKYDGFIDDFKESEVIDICNSAGLINSNVNKILKEKLARRNIAAHPGTTIVGQHQVDDMVSDLINNVVLALK